MSWEFLEEALEGFGFSARFINLIMMCVSTPKFTIKNNGEGYGYLKEWEGWDKEIQFLHSYLLLS